MSDIRKVIESVPEYASIDLAALREKYRVERDRRIRPDGEAQYIEVSGKYAHYGLDDPYTPIVQPRDPITDEVNAVVIGAGWGGLLAGARLRQAGIDNFLMLETAGDVGGVWYWNRYPGCQCDIDGYVYLPLLEETGYIPSQRFSFAPEIYRHAQRIAETFNLYKCARFHTNVESLTWDERLSRWIVRTNRGDAIKARFVITATGATNRPKLPGISGIDDFRGEIFHTARWNYDYTGGDNTGNLFKLTDKKVAFIGTGGTGIQVVPHLGRWSQHLYVFQRTPSSVDVRLNKATDPEWVRSLEPGWQAARRRNFDDIMQGKPVPDLIQDSFTRMTRSLLPQVPPEIAESLSPQELGLLSEYADAATMIAKRAHIANQVNDPKTAELLMPWYRLMCKRPTFNDEYLQTFNLPNVTLVDTSPCHGVERLTEHGIIANGVEYEADCLVMATGFEVSTSYRRRIGFDIFGRNGKNLFDHWENGMRTFHGWGSHGFPNYFYIGPGQNGFSVNFSSNCDVQATHIAYLIAQAQKAGASQLEPSADAEAAWVAEIRSYSDPSSGFIGVANAEFLESCTPGFYNNEGHSSGSAKSHVLGADVYAPGPSAFQDLLSDWRNCGKLDGVVLT